MSADESGSNEQGLEIRGARGEIVDAKYEIDRVIGTGGMGLVVAARHLHLGHQVAIKFIRGEAARDPGTVARFLREARAVVALRSEHVAKVLDVGTLPSGAPYIVMEYLDGVDLSTLIQHRRCLDFSEAVGILLEACDAIAEAHALGIVHRDLKPSNIFVTQRADTSTLVKVLDFGISKSSALNELAGPNQNLTASGSVLGTPGYMSPEQIRNVKKADARSDIWALGVILYEALGGAPAFYGETIGDILARVVAEEPTPLRELRPDVPDGLNRVIARCLEKNAALRVQTVGELAVALLPWAPRGSDLLVERIARISSPVASPAQRAPRVETVAAGQPIVFAHTAISEPRAKDATRVDDEEHEAPSAPRTTSTAGNWMKSKSVDSAAPTGTPVLQRILTHVGSLIAILSVASGIRTALKHEPSMLPSASSLAPLVVHRDHDAAVVATEIPRIPTPSAPADAGAPAVDAASPRPPKYSTDHGQPRHAATPPKDDDLFERRQ